MIDIEEWNKTHKELDIYDTLQKVSELEDRIKVLEDDKDRAARKFKATNKRYGIVADEFYDRFDNTLNDGTKI